MKITLTAEFDVSKNPALNAEDVSQIAGALQNLGSLFHELHLYHLTKISEVMANKHLTDVMREHLLASYNADANVSEQFFDNYRIQGTTDDGHTFDFTHKEPGYEEKMMVDGVVVG